MWLRLTVTVRINIEIDDRWVFLALHIGHNKNPDVSDSGNNTYF